MKKAVVIGAGIGGLATAIRLSCKGYKVHVYEANEYPGGKLSEFSINGFRFDAGPSLFTMPELVDELFSISGKNAGEYFNYVSLENICNYFFADGTRLTACADSEKFAEEASVKTGVSKEDLLRHIRKSKFIYDATAHLFLQRSLHKARSYFRWQTLSSLIKLPFLGIFSSMDEVNKRSMKNENMRQFFNRYATYNGSNPYKAPGVLNIIPHLEFSKGAFFPVNGMYAITKAVYELAKSLGVTFHFSSKIEKILVSQKKAIGIMLRGDKIISDIVVCNSDIVPVYKKLLADQRPPAKILNQERSSSALIFYWGIKKQFPALDLHNVFFSADYENEFNSIFNSKTISDDPTVYINITSKYKPDDAPVGMENWFVMINVPPNQGQNWEELKIKARESILKKISIHIKEDVESLIVAEEILDPPSIEYKTQSYQGALYGTSSNSRMAAFFRHANFSRKIKNLYFCGGSVHPGGGIPLALSSAKIVDSLISPAR